ncbi:Ig-like domain-containing protein [uncultured Alistipes sp.]|uniref:Ig-like domain-containing protein n=1 Tax=uncultured Alistipes sp. TaxID=538949 RepID=UPI0026207955|nr:Ig-like domain-containing protein [uncultured Alistipes sp.]
MKKILTALLLSLAAVTGCKKEDLDLTVTIELEPAVTVTVGQTRQLVAVVQPQSIAMSATLAWDSADKTVATVDRNGVVTALTEGKTVVTASLQNDASVSARCTVQVVKQGENPDEVVLFEDMLFETYLLVSYDANGDGKLQASEAAAIETLDVAMRGFSSLKGIEYFTHLKHLNCEYNNLKELDVTHCPELETLICSENDLRSLDLTRNPLLQTLDCSWNNVLSELDVTRCPELVCLKCGGNSLTALDVTQNPALEILDAEYNRFEHLDVTQNPELRMLDVSCSSYFASTGTQTFPPIGEIDLSRNPKLEQFDCSLCAFERLDLSSNPELTHLRCARNKLSSLDVSNNTKLRTLVVANNPIGALDVTMCPEIDTLWCEGNGLRVLDLSESRKLTWLNCSRNEIEELDFSNTELGYLLGQENRIRRIDMGEKTFGAATGYLYMKLNDNCLERLDLSRQPHLAWVELDNNNLQSLDVNACTRLRGMLCNDNPQLSELKFGQLSEVWEIHCSNCNLSGTLDFSGISRLSRISCDGNRLTTLYVWEGFDPDSTYFLADHTTGITGTFLCYVKDDSAQWVVKR